MPDRHLRDPSIMPQRSDPCRGRVLCAGSGGVAPLNPRLIAAIPSGMKMRPPSSEPGGFTECSRWLRSNAMTPPVSSRKIHAPRRDASPQRMPAPQSSATQRWDPLPGSLSLSAFNPGCRSRSTPGYFLAPHPGCGFQWGGIPVVSSRGSSTTGYVLSSLRLGGMVGVMESRTMWSCVGLIGFSGPNQEASFPKGWRSCSDFVWFVFFVVKIWGGGWEDRRGGPVAGGPRRGLFNCCRVRAGQRF